MLYLLLLMRVSGDIGLAIGQQALDEFTDLIDVEAMASKAELLHLLGLLVLSRKGNLQAEPVGIAVASH